VRSRGVAFVPAAVKVQVGKTGRVTSTKAGAIDYYCRVHPNMKGKMDVRAR
jgi:plastocyanin